MSIKKGKSIHILGMNCYMHDSSAALIKNGRIIAAAEEERFNKVKHTSEFPINSINYCLSEAKININDVEYIGFYLNPYKHYISLLKHILKYFPKSLRYFKPKLMFDQKRNSGRILLNIKNILRRKLGYKNKILFVRHHLAHATSSYFCSGFRKAAILTLDSMGEWESTCFLHGEDNRIKTLKKIYFPNSLGYVYSSVTDYLGFKSDSDEFKVMGLAAYGNHKRYIDYFKDIIKLKNDGCFDVNLDYFEYQFQTYKTVSDLFISKFGKNRKVNDKITQKHKDIAASLQKTLENTAIHLSNHLYKITKCNNLCLAGGVAMNSVMNKKIIDKTPFSNIFIPPAPNDAGTSIGAALYIYHNFLNNPIKNRVKNSFVGPSFSRYDIVKILIENKLDYTPIENISKECAKLISRGNIIGWFQDRMEFGSRALGNRSILTDPTDPKMADKVNDIKHRERWRPLAPSILEEKMHIYFENPFPSPFMSLVFQVKKEKHEEVPSVVHMNGSARVQTVNKKNNPKFYKLIKEFYKITGTPLVLNTSFNYQGKPIVRTPKDAIESFKRMNMDYLALNNFLIKKR